ncbi:MAG: ankyrin repeat domain-containing protein [Vicinamibacterales bacterium]
MSTPNSTRIPANLEQQRKLAKDLLRAARDGDPAALARIRAVRPDAAAPPRSLKLADAQLAVAREGGFESWPKLVANLQERDVKAFCDAVRGGDIPGTQQLLASTHVRKRINDPMFAFGQRAVHIAAKNATMLRTLIAAGADINMKSDWENGPYTVLDNTNEDTARFLLAEGATLTANVAARLGWLDELRTLVNADGARVHARGGDGQQPLHEARTVAIADFLLDRGAGVDVRCLDHKSTPAQYALVDRPDICRRLLERGATPDIFMAARLGDIPLATRLLDTDPACVAARINKPGYPPVPPSNIYCWSIGFGMSPHEVALKFDHRDFHDRLVARSPVRIRFINAILTADERAANAVLAEDPSLLPSLTRQDHAHLAQAIFHERFDAAELMLSLGFDAAAPGVDGGTALHAACWVGSVRMVEQLLARGGVPLDARDPTHQSTPLGWAAFGSVHRRAAGADYPAVADRLVAAGADITAGGNGAGRTLLAMAQGNPAMQEALRRHGAA